MLVPTITIKSIFSSPWFDSKCYEAYREKKRAHKLLSGNGSIDNKIKFSTLRRLIEQLMQLIGIKSTLGKKHTIFVYYVPI